MASHPLISSPTLIVYRRYKHFEWIHKILQHEFPGYILPPLPPKQELGRFNKEFLVRRAYCLERYINKIAKTEIFMNCSYVIAFLQRDVTNLEKMMEEEISFEPQKAEVLHRLRDWFDIQYFSMITNTKVLTLNSVGNILLLKI